MREIDRHIARLKARNYDWPIAWESVEALARNEGCVLVAYLCPAKVWTIGWGETEGIKPGMRWTEDQVDARFFLEVRKYTVKVEAMCTLDPTESQLGALVRLSYNIGLRSDKPKAGLYWSSVLRLHNAGDFDGAARAFQLYNKARNRQTGQLEVLAGLVTRRASEAAAYLQPDPDAPVERMPQAVEAESKLAASPIAQSGAVTVGTGVVAGASTLAETLDQSTGVLGSVKGAVGAVKDVVHQVSDLIGMQPGAMLAIALLVVGYIVLRQRAKQREGGWA